LHMDRQEQGRHTQWKEEPGKRFDFIYFFAFWLTLFLIVFVLYSLL
jgi:hypothetical protein